MAFRTAAKLVGRFEELHLLAETTGGRRNRRYRYEPHPALFEESQGMLWEGVPVQATVGGG